MGATTPSDASAPRHRGSVARDRFLEATADLLRRQGYAATGLAEITACSGAPKGSLYFHFPGGKEQLAAEALELSAARFAEALDEAWCGAPDAAASVRALAAALSARLQSSDYQLGCPLATTALETAATSPSLREAAASGFARWAGVLRARLQAEGREAAVAEEQALFVLSALEGALVLARAARSTRPLRVVAQQLGTFLAANAHRGRDESLPAQPPIR